MSLSSSKLLAFLEIAETQNISRAAARLGISQPALSMELRKLEHYFGVKLFLRTKHGVELTKAACKLEQESKRLIRDLDSLREKVLKQDRDLQGIYSIGFHPQVAAHCFPRFYVGLLEPNSLLETKLVFDSSRAITAGVIEFKIDFGIVVNPVTHPDLVILPLYSDTIRFWIKSRPSKLQNPLEENSVLIYAKNLPQMEKLVTQARAARQVQSKRILEVSDLDVIREFTASGAGIGLLPQTVAKKRSGESLIGVKNTPHYNEKICLIYRKDFQKTRAALFLKDEILRKLRSNKNGRVET